MFERYTEKARRVIFFARFEASQFGSPYIETEHFLLGILREDKALASRLALRNTESIRQEIESHTVVREKVPTSVDLPVSNEGKRVLAFAAEEADRFGHKHVGTEHLLLGLLREEKCFAEQLLRSRNLRLDQVRELVRTLEAEYKQQASTSESRASSLSEFGTDLTRQAVDGMLPSLVGREAELQRIIQVLHRRTRRNPVLVGEPGVGKRALVYGLAQRIAQGAARNLNDKRILSLDLTVIASGVKGRSRFEDKLESIRRELFDSGQGLLLFIEGLHSLVQTQRLLHLANLIKPALLDGTMRCISTTTPAEYAKTAETVPWLEELFTVIEVKPPAEAEAIQVLLSVKEHFQKFHEVTYTDEAIQYAVFHSNSYFPGRYLPEKAIDLMDEAGARVKLQQNQLPDEIVEVQKRIKFIVHRMENAIAVHEFQKARFYSDEELKERENLRLLREKYHLADSANPTVTREDIEQIVVERTGISIDSLRKSQADRPDGNEKR